MSIFKTQSLLRISAETNYDDLASASITRILFIKPDGTRGHYEATVDGTKLYYDVAAGDIDQIGIWQFQAYIEIGGLKAFGEIDEKRISRPII